jgi:hypothetical protein
MIFYPIKKSYIKDRHKMESRTSAISLYQPKPDYLVFDSGYTARLLDDDKVKLLYGLMDDYELQGISPLFVHGSAWGGCSNDFLHGESTEHGCIPIQNSMVPIYSIYPGHPEDDPNYDINRADRKASNIMDAILACKLQVRGFICFTNVRSDMAPIFILFDILKDVHYCRLFDISNIRFITAPVDGIISTIAFIDVDAESG